MLRSSNLASTTLVDSGRRSHFHSLLQSLITNKAERPGKQLHAHLIVSGDIYAALLHKLISLYAICGSLCHARHLFDTIPNPSVSLWNILIRSYAWHGPCRAAIDLYRCMIASGAEPNNFTYPLVLKACASLSAVDVGREVHDRVQRSVWALDVFVGAGLVDMYAKCGCVNDARHAFDKILHKDVVLWNSMIAAYRQNGRPTDALVLCHEMAVNGIAPTLATLVSTIAASANVATLSTGRELHGHGWRRGFAAHDKLNTTLIDMYAKCGRVRAARELFERVSEKSLVSWNAIICGYGMHGRACEALALFDQMRSESQVVPDHVTFVGVLSACNRGRLLDEGDEFFSMMVNQYSITPLVQHYTCLVDLLGHSGRLAEAYELIRMMPSKPDSAVWGALLNGCKIHKNVELGELALRNLIELEPDYAGNYVLLSNIYAQSGRWRDATNLRKLMTERGLRKEIACSWIEIKGKVHSFLVADQSHPISEAIYGELERLEGLMIESGYTPDTSTSVFHDVEDDEKTNMVRSHSERLAIAFGLLRTPPGTLLLITKNLRVCEDCHAAIKLISRIERREIVVRDINLYHHFVNGLCSCQDHW